MGFVLGWWCHDDMWLCFSAKETKLKCQHKMSSGLAQESVVQYLLCVFLELLERGKRRIGKRSQRWQEMEAMWDVGWDIGKNGRVEGQDKNYRAEVREMDSDDLSKLNMWLWWLVPVVVRKFAFNEEQSILAPIEWNCSSVHVWYSS